MRAVCALPLLLLPMAAAASCGSAFCTINTDWDTQAPWQNDATRLDLRMEYIDQDQLRSGTDKVTASGTVGEHDEIRTLNRNFVASLSSFVQLVPKSGAAGAAGIARSFAFP